MAKEIYCIYTHQNILEEKSNPEHIIPLSLGGCNSFVIPVDASTNSELGSAIDGKMANDFLIKLIRQNSDLRGHNKKEVEIKLKNSKIISTNDNSEIPAQLKFHSGGFSVYNPIERKTLTEEEINQLTKITSEFKFDKFIRTCFIAKCVLAAGYFTYKDIFVQNADHESLRKLMNLKLNETKETLKNLPLRVYDIYRPEEKDKGMAEMFKAMCDSINGSCVFFLLCKGSIVGGVGIGGKFIGAVNFKADSTKFPNDEEFRLGHVLAIQEKTLCRNSFYKVTEMLYKIYGNEEEE